MMQEAVGNCVPMQILGNIIINIKVQTAFLAAKLSVSEEIEGWGGGGGGRIPYCSSLVNYF